MLIIRNFTLNLRILYHTFYYPIQNIQPQIFISHSHTSNNVIYESDLDLDPFIGSREIDELKNFSAKAVSENEVRVKFELFGEKQDVTLRLICDKDCLFGDVRSNDAGSLKAKIKKSLKKRIRVITAKFLKTKHKI